MRIQVSQTSFYHQYFLHCPMPRWWFLADNPVHLCVNFLPPYWKEVVIE